ACAYGQNGVQEPRHTRSVENASDLGRDLEGPAFDQQAPIRAVPAVETASASGVFFREDRAGAQMRQSFEHSFGNTGTDSTERTAARVENAATAVTAKGWAHH